MFIKPPGRLFGEEAYNETSEQCAGNGGDQSIRLHLAVWKGASKCRDNQLSWCIVDVL